MQETRNTVQYADIHSSPAPARPSLYTCPVLYLGILNLNYGGLWGWLTAINGVNFTRLIHRTT